MKKIMFAAFAMALLTTALQGQIVNGDFEAGNSGFSSDYTYVAPASLPTLDLQQYTVAASPYDVHGSWTDYGDHTTGSGNMLIVNGADIADQTIWQQTVAVVSSAQYTLTYWLSSSYSTNLANIECSIAGDVSGITTLGTRVAPAPSLTDPWIEVSYTWTAGAADISATITLEDLTLQSGGNDFAIDDISLVQLSTLADLTPGVAYNLVDDEHCVTATVSPAEAGIDIWFEVSGANTTSGTETTNESGEATFCYIGTNLGEDLITATLGDVTIPVTKYWFQDNFLTGGGTIRLDPDRKGKPDSTISGNIGYLPDGTIVGNFNIVDHVGGNHLKCHNAFTYLAFSGDPATSPPASHNTATFTGDFTDKDGNVLEEVTIVIVDNDESGGGADTVGGIPLSGGNFQVHDGFK